MNSQEVNSNISEVDLPVDVRHLAEVAKVVASPAGRVELGPVLEYPQPIEGGAFDMGDGVELLPRYQALSGTAIDRTSRAISPTSPEVPQGVSPEVVAARAIEYVKQIGVLNVANRELANERMTRDDFTLAA